MSQNQRLNDVTHCRIARAWRRVRARRLLQRRRRGRATPGTRRRGARCLLLTYCILSYCILTAFLLLTYCILTAYLPLPYQGLLAAGALVAAAERDPGHADRGLQGGQRGEEDPLASPRVQEHSRGM